jgi:hypothetical protein
MDYIVMNTQTRRHWKRQQRILQLTHRDEAPASGVATLYRLCSARISKGAALFDFMGYSPGEAAAQTGAENGCRKRFVRIKQVFLCVGSRANAASAGKKA